MQSLIQTLLGGEAEVANFFSIDPHTSRILVAATSPDGDDGTVDGRSAFGALYGLDLVGNGPLRNMREACRLSFAGGSASTPALRADGTRIYIGDAGGNLLAVDRDCREVWRLAVGGQITGAIGVASDGGELYTSRQGALLKIVDRGAFGELVWTARCDMYQDLEPRQESFHLLLPAIGANGLLASASVGVRAGVAALPVRVGYAHVDRETGHLRWFAEGPEESVSVSAVGPDGGIYLANSPLRRAIMRSLAPASTGPLTGGITKYAMRRHDLLARDAACAAADRMRNVRRTRRECPDAASADARQLTALIAQIERATADAVAHDELSSLVAARVRRRVRRLEQSVRDGRFSGRARSLCRLLDRAAGTGDST